MGGRGNWPRSWRAKEGGEREADVKFSRHTEREFHRWTQRHQLSSHQPPRVRVSRPPRHAHAATTFCIKSFVYGPRRFIGRADGCTYAVTAVTSLEILGRIERERERGLDR